MLKPFTKTDHNNGLAHPSWARWFLLMVLCFVSGPALALPEDRDQPLSITADSAVRDDRVSETRYLGNVELSQGSLLIKADLLTINHSENTASLVIAEGNPATMSQTPSQGKAPVLAEAQTIEYHREEDKLVLRDGARIEQDGAVVTGAVIDYFVSSQKVNAMSSETKTEPDADDNARQRVEVIIPPSALNSKER